MYLGQNFQKFSPLPAKKGPPSPMEVAQTTSPAGGVNVLNWPHFFFKKTGPSSKGPPPICKYFIYSTYLCTVGAP